MAENVNGNFTQEGVETASVGEAELTVQEEVGPDEIQLETLEEN